MNKPQVSGEMKKELQTLASKVLTGKRDSQKLPAMRSTEELLGTENGKIHLVARLVEGLHGNDEWLEEAQLSITQAIHLVVGKCLHEKEKATALEEALTIIAEGMKIFNQSHQPPLSPELLAAETKAFQSHIRKSV